MVMQLSGGGTSKRNIGFNTLPSAGQVYSPTPPASTPAMAPTPSFASPQVSSQPYGGAPAGGWNGMEQSYQPVGGSAGGAYSPNGGGQAAAAPMRTAADFARDYSTNDQLAQVDSAFSDQRSNYANVLKKYMEDYSRQMGDGSSLGDTGGTMGRDAQVAVDGIARNRQNGLTGQAEDFFARGMGNSGVFAQEQDRAIGQYDRQNNNVMDQLKDSRADMNFRKGKFELENGENGSNIQAARREAYNRLAMAQGL